MTENNFYTHIVLAGFNKNFFFCKKLITKKKLYYLLGIRKRENKVGR